LTVTESDDVYRLGTQSIHADRHRESQDKDRYSVPHDLPQEDEDDRRESQPTIVSPLIFNDRATSQSSMTRTTKASA